VLRIAYQFGHRKKCEAGTTGEIVIYNWAIENFTEIINLPSLLKYMYKWGLLVAVVALIPFSSGYIRS
jgi:hypothetical protein